MSIAAVIKNLETERINNAELGEKIDGKVASLKLHVEAIRSQVNAGLDSVIAELDKALKVIGTEIEERDRAIFAIIQGES